MGFLQNIEQRMESLVEGVFGRAFRRQVHPVEIAKGLTRQMDEGRMVSVSRTYAPNDFTVHLSEQDNDSFKAYQHSLKDELIQYASTHAENKGYHLMTPPKIHFEVEESLRFGEFGVTARLTGGEGPRAKGAPSDTSGQTRIFRPETGEEESGGTAAISAEEVKAYGLAQEVLGLEVDDFTYPLEGSGPWTVGRSESNEITIDDPNVSRRHARILRADNGFMVEDLGSTNGTLLGGAPIDRERIDDGDELTFGQRTAHFIRTSGGPGESPRGGAASGYGRNPGGR
ncbi:DUF3662 and FHA domain-containing protein [soil metagenome]